MTRPLLDIDGAAEHLCVSQRFVRRLVHERRIPFLKIGKFIRFDLHEIDEWAHEQRTGIH